MKATLANLRAVFEFIRDIGQQLGLTQDVLFDIELAVEEASTNIIRHAYPPGQAGDLLLRVEPADDMVRITLTDWGLPFYADAVKPFDASSTIETRVKGGTGLYLIYNLMDDVVRTTASVAGEPNVLALSKRVEHHHAP